MSRAFGEPDAVMDRHDGDMLLERLGPKLGRGRSPKRVLEAVVSLLRDRVSLFRASVRFVVPDTPMVEIVAVWSAGPTALEVGTRMSAHSTALARIAATGRPEVRTLVDSRESLVDQIMAQEGIRSFVTLPLRDASHIFGLLSLSSAEPNSFAEADLELLEEVARLVEDALRPGASA